MSTNWNQRAVNSDISIENNCFYSHHFSWRRESRAQAGIKIVACTDVILVEKASNIQPRSHSPFAVQYSITSVKIKRLK